MKKVTGTQAQRLREVRAFPRLSVFKINREVKHSRYLECVSDIERSLARQ